MILPLLGTCLAGDGETRVAAAETQPAKPAAGALFGDQGERIAILEVRNGVADDPPTRTGFGVPSPS